MRVWCGCHVLLLWHFRSHWNMGLLGNMVVGGHSMLENKARVYWMQTWCPVYTFKYNISNEDWWNCAPNASSYSYTTQYTLWFSHCAAFHCFHWLSMMESRMSYPTYWRRALWSRSTDLQPDHCKKEIWWATHLCWPQVIEQSCHPRQITLTHIRGTDNAFLWVNGLLQVRPLPGLSASSSPPQHLEPHSVCHARWCVSVHKDAIWPKFHTQLVSGEGTI